MRNSLLNNNSNQIPPNNQFMLSHQQATNPANYASGGVMGAPHAGLIGFGTGTSGNISHANQDSLKTHAF